MLYAVVYNTFLLCSFAEQKTASYYSVQYTRYMLQTSPWPLMVIIKNLPAFFVSLQKVYLIQVV